MNAFVTSAAAGLMSTLLLSSIAAAQPAGCLKETARFTTVANGCLDRATKLVWADAFPNTSANLVTWNNVQPLCAGVTQGDMTGWRAADTKSLYALLWNLDAVGVIANVNAGDVFLSSSTTGGYPTEPTIWAQFCSVGGGCDHYSTRHYQHRLRPLCARPATAAQLASAQAAPVDHVGCVKETSRFKNVAFGCYDRATNLVWADPRPASEPANGVRYENVNAACASTVQGNVTGWRAATESEAKMLTLGGAGVGILTNFDNGDYFMTSTLDGGSHLGMIPFPHFCAVGGDCGSYNAQRLHYRLRPLCVHSSR